MSQNNTQNDEEDLSELDAKIREESQEYNQTVPDEVIQKEAEETDKHYTPIDQEVLAAEAEEYDSQQPDEATIKQEAEKCIEPNEKKYRTFCNRVNLQVSQIYDAIFQKDNKYKDGIKSFIRETILEIDGRIGLFSREATLDTLIRDYAIRDANITSKKLTQEEIKTYNLFLAIKKIKQAMEKPAFEQELLEETYELLQNAETPEIAQNLNLIVQAIKKFYERE